MWAACRSQNTPKSVQPVYSVAQNGSVSVVLAEPPFWANPFAGGVAGDSEAELGSALGEGRLVLEKPSEKDISESSVRGGTSRGLLLRLLRAEEPGGDVTVNEPTLAFWGLSCAVSHSQRSRHLRRQARATYSTDPKTAANAMSQPSHSRPGATSSMRSAWSCSSSGGGLDGGTGLECRSGGDDDDGGGDGGGCCDGGGDGVGGCGGGGDGEKNSRGPLSGGEVGGGEGEGGCGGGKGGGGDGDRKGDGKGGSDGGPSERRWLVSSVSSYKSVRWRDEKLSSLASQRRSCSPSSRTASPSKLSTAQQSGVISSSSRACSRAPGAARAACTSCSGT